MSVLIDQILLQYVHKVKPITHKGYGCTEVGVSVHRFGKPILFLTAHSLTTIEFHTEKINLAITKALQRFNFPLHKLSCQHLLTFINHRTYAVMRGGAISFFFHRRCDIYFLLFHNDIFFMRPKIGVC
ncbi:hypothetical protein HMPREF1640_13575 [Prevotella sp. S7-1-8]|nr:hypothetical protein HMPREF1640_13575 [Prevotella sp. S7-1-8]